MWIGYGIVTLGSCLHQALEVLLGTCRDEFVLRIVVVDTVAEEYSFCINKEVLVLLALFVACVLPDDFLQGFPDAQIILEVLVEKDVASTFAGFAQMVDQSLLI